MAKSRDNWRRFLDAAQRKIAIAAYHAHCLEKEHSIAVGDTSDAPSIPIQAQFEGVIVSVMAAVDQVAQALNSALALRLSPAKLVEGAFGHLQTIPQMDAWFTEPIGRDLRRIRVRMVHYSYAKTQQGLVWVVESADTDFKGSRELLAYAKSAVVYGSKPQSLLPLIVAELERQGAVSPARGTKGESHYIQAAPGPAADRPHE
jgi:hypothetical protein